MHPAAKGKRALQVLKLADCMDELMFEDVIRFFYVVGMVRCLSRPHMWRCLAPGAVLEAPAAAPHPQPPKTA